MLIQSAARLVALEELKRAQLKLKTLEKMKELEAELGALEALKTKKMKCHPTPGPGVRAGTFSVLAKLCVVFEYLSTPYEALMIATHYHCCPQASY